MKKFSKILSVALLVALVLSLGIASAFADPATHTVSTASTTHTYEIYQVFTGTYDADSGMLLDLKYGQNSAKGTVGASVSATDMAALDTIAHKTYTTDQAKIDDLSAYVTLSNPVATIGKGNDSSATLVEGYYVIKDMDDSLQDPEAYTLYIFGTLSEDLEIQPKSGTTTVDKTVTETADATGTTTEGQKGADYDQGDSIPYSINVTLAPNVHDYKTYSVTLTDTLSAGLTPPEVGDVTVTFTKGGTAVDTEAYGSPEVSISGQVITVTYTVGDGVNAIGSTALDGAVINVSYNAVLNENAVVGVEGNPNTYTLTYTNNPNSDDTGTTPEKKVFVYTYELDIVKVDGNDKPLEGADFTLYKEVTATYENAQTGADIKATFTDTKVDASKLDDAKYYVPVGMTEHVTKGDNDVVTNVTHKTDTTIDAGNYVLVETTVPDGYNAYSGETIVITHTIDATTGALTGLTATPSDKLTVATDLDIVSGSVVNQSGATLPSTGGIGTTIFYVVGGVLVLAAIILLVTKKRMSE